MRSPILCTWIPAASGAGSHRFFYLLVEKHLAVQSRYSYSFWDRCRSLNESCPSILNFSISASVRQTRFARCEPVRRSRTQMTLRGGISVMPGSPTTTGAAWLSDTVTLSSVTALLVSLGTFFCASLPRVEGSGDSGPDVAQAARPRMLETRIIRRIMNSPGCSRRAFD